MKYLLRTLLAIFFSLMPIFQMGCSSENGIDSEQTGIQSDPLWVLKGHVEDGGDVPQDLLTDVYAAVVWQKFVKDVDDDGVPEGYQVAQTLPVNVNFPISFELGLYELPPEDVLVDNEMCEYMSNMICADPAQSDDLVVVIDAPDSPENGSSDSDTLLPYKWTLGFVVMFQDGNGNGTLDMSKDGKHFTDTIIGSAPNHTLLYIESEHEHPVYNASQLTRGLSIYKGIPGVVITQDAKGNQIEPMSMDEPIEIAMASDLLNQAFMCPNGHNSLQMDPDGFVLASPITCEAVPAADMKAHFPGMIINGRDGFCSLDLRKFTWYQNNAAYPETTEELCTSSLYVDITGFKVSVLSDGETAPDWWPCTGDGTERETFLGGEGMTSFFIGNDYEKYLDGELTEQDWMAFAELDLIKEYEDGTTVDGMTMDFVFDDWVSCAELLSTRDDLFFW